MDTTWILNIFVGVLATLSISWLIIYLFLRHINRTIIIWNSSITFIYLLLFFIFSSPIIKTIDSPTQPFYISFLLKLLLLPAYLMYLNPIAYTSGDLALVLTWVYIWSGLLLFGLMWILAIVNIILITSLLHQRQYTRPFLKSVVLNLFILLANFYLVPTILTIFSYIYLKITRFILARNIKE